MPLRDHFHPPLSVTRHWESLLGDWTSRLKKILNRHLLPEGYFASIRVRHREDPHEIETLVYREKAITDPLAAIAFVSPRNKDRREACRAFAAKWASYLQHGVGLVIIDVVTEQRTNLHNELIEYLDLPENCRFTKETPLYAASYRPSRQTADDNIEMWLNPLGVGEVLPTMPLSIRGELMVPLELEATYTEVLRDSRL